MAKLKAPKKLAEYTTAEEAARGLEDMAAEIRAHSSHRPMVRYAVNLSYWNPSWLVNEPRGVLMMGVSYGNAPMAASTATPEVTK